MWEASEEIFVGVLEAKTKKQVQQQFGVCVGS
jgi:hypothetical protein